MHYNITQRTARCLWLRSRVVFIASTLFTPSSIKTGKPQTWRLIHCQYIVMRSLVFYAPRFGDRERPRFGGRTINANVSMNNSSRNGSIRSLPTSRLLLAGWLHYEFETFDLHIGVHTRTGCGHRTRCGRHQRRPPTCAKRVHSFASTVYI